MKKSNTRKIVFAAVLCALVCVATAVFPIPLGNGYANLGDTLISLCPLFLGPLWGFLAAGVGSALADVFLGYVTYAPVTLIIKGSMALIYTLLFCPFAKTKARIPMALIAAIAAEAVMVLGYFVFECILYTPAGALPNIAGNLIQATAGCATSTVLLSLLSNSKLLKKSASGDLHAVII